MFIQRLEPLDETKPLPADSIYESPTEICELTHESIIDIEDNNDYENNSNIDTDDINNTIKNNKNDSNNNSNIENTNQ